MAVLPVFLGIALAVTLPLQVAHAHNPVTSSGHDQLAGLLGLVCLGVFWLIYLRGSRVRPVSSWRCIGFHGTAILCLITLFGPVDDWAHTSTAAHMVQHMLLMVVIAPLWVLSRPLPQLVAGAGRSMVWIWTPWLRLAGRPLVAAYLHGAIIWFWHTPRFYMAAVENPWWHAVEHACFLVSAGLFWWAVLRCPRRDVGLGLLAVLFTLMHTGFLGALLTFADAPLYGEARDLADQQLAGLIMWVVGAIPYLAASAWIGYRWYRQMAQRMDAAH